MKLSDVTPSLGPQEIVSKDPCDFSMLLEKAFQMG